MCQKYSQKSIEILNNPGFSLKEVDRIFNLPRKVVDLVSENGHDILWIKNIAPKSSDDQILRLSHEQRSARRAFKDG
jgi:hypothetical protein